MDVFIEYIVKRKKDLKDKLTVTGIIVLALVVTVLVTSINLGFFGQFGLLVVVGAWYGAYHFITARNVEYEYAVTNGELDVDAIVARRKRKRMITVKTKEFELVAPANDVNYQKDFTNTNITKVIDASTNDGSDGIYFALFRKEGNLVKLLFNPPPKMLAIFKKYRPQNVFVAPGQEVESV